MILGLAAPLAASEQLLDIRFILGCDGDAVALQIPLDAHELPLHRSHLVVRAKFLQDIKGAVPCQRDRIIELVQITEIIESTELVGETNVVGRRIHGRSYGSSSGVT